MDRLRVPFGFSLLEFKACAVLVEWFVGDVSTGGGAHPRTVHGSRNARFAWNSCNKRPPDDVWEWTADWYSESYYKESPKTDPQGPSTGTYRSVRGGSWVNSPWNARVSNRLRFEATFRDFNIGFRCAGE